MDLVNIRCDQERKLIADIFHLPGVDIVITYDYHGNVLDASFYLE